MSAAEPVFRREDDAWRAGRLARGPWDPALAHGGAPAALLAREVEQVAGGPGWAVARLCIDFLGPVALGPVAVAAELVRPGRRMRLARASLRAGGREACLASAVLLARAAVGEVPATPGPEAPPAPDVAGEPYDPLGAGLREGFFPTAMELRLAGGTPGAGASTVWLRLRAPLVAGEAPSPLQRAVAAADFANGLSWVLPFAEWTFVNTELSVHLHREPEGEWVALAARTDVGPEGAGVAAATLFDVRGRIGVAAQSLFVARRGSV